MTRLPQVALATIVAMTGLYLTSSASKAMPIQQKPAIAASDSGFDLARYMIHRRHEAYRYGYRPYYGYGYGYGYGWRHPVLGVGLGVGGLYLGL